MGDIYLTVLNLYADEPTRPEDEVQRWNGGDGGIALPVLLNHPYMRRLNVDVTCLWKIAEDARKWVWILTPKGFQSDDTRLPNYHPPVLHCDLKMVTDYVRMKGGDRHYRVHFEDLILNSGLFLCYASMKAGNAKHAMELGFIPGGPGAVSYTHLTLPTIYSV